MRLLEPVCKMVLAVCQYEILQMCVFVMRSRHTDDQTYLRKTSVFVEAFSRYV